MRHITLTIAVAVLVAACSDHASNLPLSPLRPSGPAFDETGTPPPPPVRGEGFADFFAGSRDDGDEEAAACTASMSFSFSYQYVGNKQGTNAVLHVSQTGPGSDVTIHQTNKKLQANGTIVGPGFSFKIADAIGGGIIDVEEHFPSFVSVQVNGTLTMGSVKCTANATLNLSLTGGDHH